MSIFNIQHAGGRRELQRTDLMSQHPLQPVLPSSGQVDGQSGTTALHHHHGLGQQLVRQTHHDLDTHTHTYTVLIITLIRQFNQ